MIVLDCALVFHGWGKDDVTAMAASSGVTLETSQPSPTWPTRLAAAMVRPPIQTGGEGWRMVWAMLTSWQVKTRSCVI